MLIISKLNTIVKPIPRIRIFDVLIKTIKKDAEKNQPLLMN